MTLSFWMVIICMFEVLMYFEFSRNILTARYKKKSVNLLFFALASLFLVAINSLHNSTLNLFIVPAVMTGIAILVYEDDIRRIAIYMIICWCILAEMEFVGTLIYGLLLYPDNDLVSGYPYENFLLIAIIKTVTYLVIRIIKLFIRKNGTEAKSRLFVGVLILPVTTIILFAGIFYAKVRVEQHGNILGVGSVLLLFTNIVVFYIFEKLVAVMEQNRVFEMEKLQYELKRQHYDRLNEINSDTGKFVHNLKEQITTISRLARKNQNEEILRILGDIEADTDRIMNKNYTSNKLLNAILCEKEQLAAKNNISMMISVEPQIEVDFIKSGDLIVMVSNLINNAIEAAGKCDDGYVNVSINGTEDKFVVIIVENNYTGKIMNSGGRYLSSKRGYREYGLGIHCVEETVKKYGGILRLHHGDGFFKSILTIAKNFNP